MNVILFFVKMLLCGIFRVQKKENDPEQTKHKASVDLKNIIDLDMLPSHKGCRFDIHTQMGRTVALLAETPQLCKQWYDKINQARSNAPLASLFGPSFKAFEEESSHLPLASESHKDYILPSQSVKEGFLALEREDDNTDEDGGEENETRKIISTKYYFVLTDRLHYLGRALASDLKGASVSKIADAIHSAKSLPLHGDTKLEPILPLPDQTSRETSKSKIENDKDKEFQYRFKVFRFPPMTTVDTEESTNTQSRWNFRKWRKEKKKRKERKMMLNRRKFQKFQNLQLCLLLDRKCQIMRMNTMNIC